MRERKKGIGYYNPKGQGAPKLQTNVPPPLAAMHGRVGDMCHTQNQWTPLFDLEEVDFNLEKDLDLRDFGTTLCAVGTKR